MIAKKNLKDVVTVYFKVLHWQLPGSTGISQKASDGRSIGMSCNTLIFSIISGHYHCNHIAAWYFYCHSTNSHLHKQTLDISCSLPVITNFLGPPYYFLEF